MVLLGFSLGLRVQMALLILLSEDLCMLGRFGTLEGFQHMPVGDLLSRWRHSNGAWKVLMHVMRPGNNVEVFIIAVMTVIVSSMIVMMVMLGSALLLSLIDSLDIRGNFLDVLGRIFDDMVVGWFNALVPAVIYLMINMFHAVFELVLLLIIQTMHAVGNRFVHELVELVLRFAAAIRRDCVLHQAVDHVDDWVAFAVVFCDFSFAIFTRLVLLALRLMVISRLSVMF